MRIVRRIGVFSVLALTLAAGCITMGPPGAGASGLAYGTLPGPHGTPINGGTVTIANPPGAGPTYILPIVPESDFTVSTIDQFQDFSWRPLWWSPKGDQPEVDYSQSIGNAPVFTNNNMTATITLKKWFWSDGSPVTSLDVAFDIDLQKAAVAISPDNDGGYTPGLFPDNVASVATPNAQTVVVTLTKSYNQDFAFLDQLGTLTPLPVHAWSKTSPHGALVDFTNPAKAKAIYRYLNGQSNHLTTYGTNPLWQVVDGPYKIASYDPSTGASTFVANENYSGPVHPRITRVENVSFTSISSEFDQLLTGKLDVGFVDPSDLPQVPKLRNLGYDVWGAPDFGNNYIVYNFKDKTGDFGNIISQLYVRQALAHLQNQQAEIESKGIYDGAAGPDYGPVPAVPVSPFAPSNAFTNPYPFSISTASSLLSTHGWKVVPNGSTFCASPGTGPHECGAGIPKSTPITFKLIVANTSPSTLIMDEAIASNAKQVGITIKLETKTFNFIIGNLSDPANPSNINEWATEDYGGDTDDIYPTQEGLFNTTGTSNSGDFSNAFVDAAINNSEYSPNPDAIMQELSIETTLQPGLFQPNADLVTAFSKKLGGPSDSFADSSQYQFSPEYWYFTK